MAVRAGRLRLPRPSTQRGALWHRLSCCTPPSVLCAGRRGSLIYHTFKVTRGASTSTNSPFKGPAEPPPRHLPSLEALAMMGVATVGVATLLDAAYDSPMSTCQASEASYRPHCQELKLGAATARAIRRGEVVVMDDVLRPEVLAVAREDVRRLKRSGRFKVNANDDEAMRSDSVCWVGGEEEEEGKAQEGEGLGHCIRLLKGIARELQETEAYDKARLVVQQAAQLACYDGDDAHYNAHLDAQTDTLWSLGLLEWLRSRIYRQRSVTAILYLNQREWDCEKEGGALRCYDDIDNDGKGYVDVAPNGGRLILFNSKVILHEVMPTYAKERIALTVWIGDES